MNGEKYIDMTWNCEKDLLLVNSLIKTPFWNKASQFDFNNKCHLRELLQKCSGGKIVEMLKWLLSAEEKTALIKNELQSFFQSQAMQSFENHIKIKHEVEVKQEPGSEVGPEPGPRPVPQHKHESSSLQNLRLKKHKPELILEPRPEIEHEIGPEPGHRIGPKVLKVTDTLQRIIHQDNNSGNILKNSQSNELLNRIQSEAVYQNSQSNESLPIINYKCKLCKFETLETSNLKNHMLAGHDFDEDSDWNKYIQLCKRVIIENPEPGSEPGPTPELNPSFLRNVRLKKHKLEPEGEYIPSSQKELNHFLPEKNKERSESHLTLSQKDTKPYKCDKCGAKFSQQNILDQHIVALHEEKNPFKCGMCNVMFSSRSQLDHHMVHIHKAKIVAVHEKEKPFKCGMCIIKFPSKFHLNRHMVHIHKAKKMFKCKICNLTYVELNDLKKHLALGHEVKQNKSTLQTK